MIFELINPSDAYTFEAKNHLAAALATVFVGNGNYGADQVDGAGDFKVPPFLFGGADEWFCEKFGATFQDVLNRLETSDMLDLADALDSFLIGDYHCREHYQLALESAVDKQAFRDDWHNRHRSSMNNIGLQAWALAKNIREKEGKKK